MLLAVASIGYTVLALKFATSARALLPADAPYIQRYLQYGKEFGDAKINIAGMQIARQQKGGQALSVLTVDSPVPSDLLERVRDAIDATLLREIDVLAG